MLHKYNSNAFKIHIFLYFVINLYYCIDINSFLYVQYILMYYIVLNFFIVYFYKNVIEDQIYLLFFAIMLFAFRPVARGVFCTRAPVCKGRTATK